MVQREVAERLEAQPGTGDYGVLSISVQLHADVKPSADPAARRLPSGARRCTRPSSGSTFRPPAVGSADEGVFEAMVRSMFTQRRKTLGNALAPFAEHPALDAREALRAAGIDPRRRPETLQLSELARLADHFAENAS